MFKKGDIIEALETYGRHFTKGRMYTVAEDVRLGRVKLEKNDEGKTGILFAVKCFKLVASSQVSPGPLTVTPNTPVVTPSTHGFKKGDMVECLTSCRNQFTKGRIYTVDDVKDVKDWFLYVEKDDKGNKNGWDKANFKPCPVPTYRVFGGATEIAIDTNNVSIDIDLGPSCKCGNGHNKKGQGHSRWCDLFKQEF